MSLKDGISSITALLGTSVSYFLGGWDVLLQALIFMMVLDYITGVLGAIRQKQLSSEVMYWGGIRKAVIIGVIALAVYADQLLGNDAPIFRALAVYFYLSREGLSVVENLGLIGVPLPPFVKEVLLQLQKKGGEK